METRTRSQSNELIRCPWGFKETVLRDYHDKEWGVPVYNDQILFEYLSLGGFQAGLNWLSILKKRDSFRKAFHDFDPIQVAQFTEQDRARLLEDKGIVRNKVKINAVIWNAQLFLALQQEKRSFSAFLWEMVNYQPITNHYTSLKEIPVSTKLSDQLSAELTKRKFKFVGSVICYAFLQATGVVNDHVISCFRSQEIINDTKLHRQ